MLAPAVHWSADFDQDKCTYHYDTRVRVGVECLRACGRLLARIPQLDVPFMVVHSVKDDMTDPNGSKLLAKQAKVRAHKCDCAKHKI